MVVAGGHIEKAVLRAEAQPAAAVRPGPAPAVERRLEGDVGDDVGTIAHRGVGRVHLQADHPVGRLPVEFRGHEQVEAPVVGKGRVQGQAEHAALALAEQVVRGYGRTACAEQVADRAVRGAHRQAAAFFGEEQGSVGGKGEVPGIVQVGEDDRALDAQISRLGRPGRRGEDQDRGQQQDRGEQEQGGCGCSMHGVLLGAGPGHEAACPAAPPIRRWCHRTPFQEN